MQKGSQFSLCTTLISAKKNRKTRVACANVLAIFLGNTYAQQKNTYNVRLIKDGHNLTIKSSGYLSSNRVHRGGSRILERRGPTMEDSEMSRRSRRGDAEGVTGGECERALNPLSLGGSRDPSPENFQNFGAFSCHLGTLQPYCQAS